MIRPSIYSPNKKSPHERGGGFLPSIRPHYPARIARALHQLAESNPTPNTYTLERARILEGHT